MTVGRRDLCKEWSGDIKGDWRWGSEWGLWWAFQ